MANTKTQPPMGPLGHALRLFRRERNMTQPQLATAIGCKTPFICQIERGERGISADMANKLKAIGLVDVDDMVLADSLLRVVRSARGGT